MSEPSTNSMQLDALLKLFLLAESTEGAPLWLRAYLYDAFPAGPDGLVDKSDDELQEVINSTIDKFTENEEKVPDILFNFTELNSTVLEVDQKGNESLTNIDSVLEEAGQSANESTDDNENLAYLQKKLEVAKGFVQELDEKYSKSESIIADLNSKLESEKESNTLKSELLSKFESLGTVDELNSLKTNYQELTDKHESTCSELDSMRELSEKAEAQEKESKKTKENEDSKTMTTEDKDLLLKRYQELGTPEEFKEFKDECGKQSEDLKSKDESIQRLELELDRYTAIGDVEDLESLLDSVYREKLESEAERISQEYKVPKEKAISIIEKFESIAEVEEFFQDLLPKHEATEPNTDEASRLKAESDEAEALALAEAKLKAESVEQAELVHQKAKHESADNPLDQNRRTTLSGLIDKI